MDECKESMPPVHEAHLSTLLSPPQRFYLSELIAIESPMIEISPLLRWVVEICSPGLETQLHNLMSPVS